jgi:DNA-binding CsgD family transcriptional regulator
MSQAAAVAPDLVSLACTAGHQERALAVIAALDELALRYPSPRLEGSLLRCRGLLAEDPGLLLEAVTAYRRSPQPVMLAGALEDAAVALGRAGRLPEARPLIDEALTIYERVGARRDTRRVLGILRDLGVRLGRRGPRQRPKDGWNSLSETEREVVRLVVEGLTNAKIAERLFISRRTVETHLSHVFAKLGVSSRRELAEAPSANAAED